MRLPSKIASVIIVGNIIDIIVDIIAAKTALTEAAIEAAIGEGTLIVQRHFLLIQN
jgi:hypothetical protein